MAIPMHVLVVVLEPVPRGVSISAVVAVYKVQGKWDVPWLQMPAADGLRSTSLRAGAGD